MIDEFRKSIFRVECGNEQGTCFLIAKGVALTVFHAVRDSELNKPIILNNEENIDIVASLSLLTCNECKSLDIAILDVPELCCSLPIINLHTCNDSLSGKKWSSRGYISAKGNDGLDIHENETTIISSYYNDLSLDRPKHDIDLNISAKWDSYNGMSGSPLFIDNSACGIINQETQQGYVAKELCALSFNKISKLLHKKGIIINNYDIKKIDIHFDDSATQSYKHIAVDDIRSLRDKLRSVCKEIRDARVQHYGRRAVNSNIELSKYPDAQVNAFKYRIFEACQEKLLELVEQGLNQELGLTEIREILSQFVDVSYNVIYERSTDYAYPIKNRDSIENTILSLIDECYLSFDEEGIYE